MRLSELKPSEIQKIRDDLEKIPRDTFDIDEKYEVIEFDLPNDVYNFLVELSGSNDEVEMSYTVNRLLHSHLKSITQESPEELPK